MSSEPFRPRAESIPANTLIDIDHVSFGYDASRTILNDVSLTFQRGRSL